MSIWDNIKNLTQPYADEDEELEEEELETEAAESEETAPRARRTPVFSSNRESSFSASTASGFSAQVVGGSGSKQEVILFRPVSFNDTSKAADELRARKAVILNMENVDSTMSRRVVDFLSGCAYAVNGKVKKIAQSTYLFCPQNMDVSGDLENLQVEAESYV